MIKNLNTNDNVIAWCFNDKKYEIEIENTFFASEDIMNSHICIEAGINFIRDRVYYYDYYGRFKLMYDLNDGKVEWIYKGEKKSMHIFELFQIGFFFKKGRIIVLSGEKTQELKGYSLEGECLFAVAAPTGVKVSYLTESKQGVFAVCDGGREREDEFGRSKYNFNVNLNTGELTRASLAY